MAAPLILRIITDASQTLRANQGVIASNTLVGKSALDMGADIVKSSKAAITSSVAMEEALAKEAATYRELSVSASLSAKEQVKAAQLSELAQAKLARSQGLFVAGARASSEGSKTAERDLGKLTRGALAGSGVISSLGRSLAFASGGFIAVAGTATLLHNAIADALSYAATERQVTAQLKTSGKIFEDYKGQIEASLTAESRLSGFTRQDLLQSFGYLVRVSGNVQQSLHLDAVAADVARGRHIALSSASLALAKALGGSDTALRRLGIIIPKNLKGLDALQYVAKKFAGQAEAGATSADHLHASLTTASEVIGTAVLPTFNRLVTEFSDWVTKMEASGRLQRDANEAFSLAGDIFHTLGDAIKVVDSVTGSFKHTLELLIALELSKVAAGWIVGLTKLAEAWGLVGASATTAGAAQAAALGTGEASALAGAGAGAAGSAALRSRVGQFTGTMVPAAAEAEVAGIGAAAATSTAEVAGLRAGLLGLSALEIAPIVLPIVLLLQDKSIRGNLASQIQDIRHPSAGGIGDFFKSGLQNAVSILQHTGIAAPAYLNQPAKQPYVSPFETTGQFQAAGLPVGTTTQLFGPPPSTSGLFGGIKPMQQFWKKFALSFSQQLAQANAALTKGTADDVAEAQKEVEQLKTLINNQQVKGPALLQALALEAQALGVIWSAEQAAAQKRAADAQAAKQKIITDIQNAIDPIKLEVALSKAQAFGQTTVPALKALLKAAYAGLAKAISSGNEDLVKQAYDQITSLKQAIKDAQKQVTKQFTEPMKLQIALARAQAFGGDTTSILTQMKAAALKALKSGKYAGQGLIDLLNEIANINSQLSSSTVSAYGDYKKASVKALTANLGLSDLQRKRLEERLSQRGPGGTVPATGTGAAGYIIDPATGRPVRVGHPGHTSTYTPSSVARGGAVPEIKAVIDLTVNIDGKHVEATVTKQQQRRRSRNPTQTRGPNAATSVA